MLQIKKEKFQPTLQKFGFDLNTKCFMSYIYNKKSSFSLYEKAIRELDYSPRQAKVYALMLLNYHLNGSTVNWGCPIDRSKPWYSRTNKAHSLLGADKAQRDVLMKNWVSRIKPLTFAKYDACVCELDKNLIDFQKELAAEKAVKVVTQHAKKVNPYFAELTLSEIEQILGYKVKLLA